MLNILPVTVTPRGLLAVALTGSIVAALFGAAPLAAWADALPESRAATILQQAADTWRDLAQRVDFDRPYSGLRRAVRDAESARFGD